MEPLSELLATTERQALEFFFVGLRDVSDGEEVDQRELLYNASILAHYAQVSTRAGFDIPAPSTLMDVFDQFVLDDAVRHDPALLETAATQCLLLAGFFESQMRGRHNIRFYSGVGAGFFREAAHLERSRAKAELLDTVGRHFEPWRVRYARLSHELRVRPYVISRPTSPDDLS
jgi:hypothetical protein